jgi:MFS family permease
VVGRFVLGIGVAVSGVADVSYLHECSPIEWRGSIVSVNEACISLGFLLAYIAGYVFADEGAEEWRVVFLAAGILAAIQFIGTFVVCFVTFRHMQKVEIYPSITHPRCLEFHLLFSPNVGGLIYYFKSYIPRSD